MHLTLQQLIAPLQDSQRGVERAFHRHATTLHPLGILPVADELTRRPRTTALKPFSTSSDLDRFQPMPRPSAVPSRLAFGFRNVTRVPQLAERKRFPVASIDFSRSEVVLPFGVPRFVNAATLKMMAGARRVDRLLKQTRKGWEFVADNVMVDLSDGSVRFKIGKLTIFS